MNEQLFFFFYGLAHQSVFFDQIVIFFAVYFPIVVILLAKIFLLYHHEVLPSKDPWQEFVKKWKEILLVFITSGLAWVVAKVLKLIIHTERPFAMFKEVQNLFIDDSFAFPSGHAAFFMALAVSLFFCHRKIGVLFMFFALLISLARVIAGVHFPIDILGGFILGSLTVYIYKCIYTK